VRNGELKERLVAACRGQGFISDPGTIVVGVADPSKRWYKIDMAISFDHLSLEATELGLGTCWIGAFDQEKVKEVLGIPAKLEVVILMKIGIPDEEPAPTSRKNIEELICYDGYE
jgi:nitroreductase